MSQSITQITSGQQWLGLSPKTAVVSRAAKTSAVEPAPPTGLWESLLCCSPSKYSHDRRGLQCAEPARPDWVGSPCSKALDDTPPSISLT